MKYSIIIPTFNKIDVLKSCLSSVTKHTDLSATEVIVVSNGCTDGTENYVKSLGEPFKILHWKEPLGYSKAINLGVLVSKGEYKILLNNDCVVLGNNWIDILEEPFKRFKSAGITGPSSMTRAGIPWLIFFCVMIKDKVFKEVGYLDEQFLIGGGEDTDFCIKAYNLGFTNYLVPLYTGNSHSHNRVSYFPLYHPGEGTTRSHIENFKTVIKQNEALLTKRYGIP